MYHRNPLTYTLKTCFHLLRNSSLPFVVLVLAFGCQKNTSDQDRPLSDALSTFELEEGFQIELVAGEPLIADPVAMEIDEEGRLYVVEMHGYPLDVSGTGKVKLLSDTDGDGQMDKSTVFADSLVMPTGIMRWKKGVIVTDPPHVYYLEDTDGDSRSDVKKTLLTGFALSNPQHNVNSPKLALNNWIYLGHEPAVTTTIYEDKFGDRGNDVYFPDDPSGKRLPQNAGGRSIRFRPDTYELELLGSRTQFGHTADQWGHRFLVTNSNHVIQEMISAEYLNRNPFLVITDVTQSVSDHGSAAEVFPITKNPENQLLTDVGVMTSACGITAYLGAEFPSRYQNALFVAEPVSNLVHVDLLQEDGTGFVASREHPEKEFLASTDSWFRPVNMYVGPDGALYMLDYYRQYIEHPEWMADDVVNSGALYNGTDKGRIYRITPKGTAPLDWSEKLNLATESNESLIGMLSHKNVWWRMNAQRILVDRKPASGKSQLEDLAKNGDDALGRLHALWTLQGIGQLEKGIVVGALHDPVAGIRESAIKLAELMLPDHPDLAESLYKLSSDTDPKVRFQLLSTLGFVESDRAFQVRKELLFEDIEDNWVQLAALSAPFSQSRQLTEAVLVNFTDSNPSYGSMVQKLASMIGASRERTSIYSMAKRGTNPGPENDYSWQAPLLRGLALGIKSKEGAGDHTRTEQVLVNSVFEHPSMDVRKASIQVLQGIGLSESFQNKKAVEKAKNIAGDKSKTGEERSLCIQFLALTDPLPYKSFLADLLEASEPLPVQVSALKTLSLVQDEAVPQLLLEKWESFTPELRDEAINALMMAPDRISILLDALESGLIQKSNLGWRRSVRLMANREEGLRLRARAIINSSDAERTQVIEAYQPALDLNGSAINGKAIFQQNCALCHKMGEETGMVFGPDLSSLKNRSYSSIMSDILNPNLSIADGYDLWMMELKNGEILQGLISSETPTAIKLRNAGGLDREISRADIKSLKVSDISAMPTGLEQSISPQEMADLLAYIRKN